MNMNQVLATKGIASDELIDFNTRLTQQSRPTNAAEEAPPIVLPNGDKVPARFIKIRVPEFMSDPAVYAAISFGSHAVQNAERGVVTILFPHVQKGENGQPIPSIAKFDMVAIGPEDVQRLLKVAEAITKQNIELLNAQKNPINAVGAAKNAKTVKDNIVRDMVGKVNGQGGGILIA